MTIDIYTPDEPPQSRGSKLRHDANPVIRRLSADCGELVIEFTTSRGERVIGEYSLCVWGWPPARIRKQVEKSLATPPRAVFGRRG